MRVYYQDTDAAGVVFHATYLDFFERARMEWMRSRGFDARQLASGYRVAFVVRQLEVSYFKPALLDDQVQVGAVLETMGRAQLTFAQTIRRGSETLVRATVNVACVEIENFKPVAIPRAVRESLADGVAPATRDKIQAGEASQGAQTPSAGQLRLMDSTRT